MSYEQDREDRAVGRGPELTPCPVCRTAVEAFIGQKNVTCPECGCEFEEWESEAGGEG